MEFQILPQFDSFERTVYIWATQYLKAFEYPKCIGPIS